MQLTNHRRYCCCRAWCVLTSRHQVVNTIGDASSDLLGGGPPRPCKDLWIFSLGIQRSPATLSSPPSPPPFNPLLAHPPRLPAHGLPWCDSNPPSSGASNLLELALPGSPLYRCFSYARLVATGGRRRNHASNAPQTLPPSPPPPIPPPRPDTIDSRPKDLTNRSRDFDVESAESSTTTVSGQPARPVAARGKGGGAGGGCMARRPSAAAALEVLFAACVGSALDLDHFLAAGSLRLSRATALAGRPWGHCVAALIVAVRSKAERQTKRFVTRTSVLWRWVINACLCHTPVSSSHPIILGIFPIHILAGK